MSDTLSGREAADLRAFVERYADQLEQMAGELPTTLTNTVTTSLRAIAEHLRTRVRIDTATPGELARLDAQLHEQLRVEANTATPMVTISYVTVDNTPRLRVELAAATEMAFEVILRSGTNHDRLVAAVCHVAPALLLYDMAMMEAGDDGGRTRIPLQASIPVRDFLERYRDDLINISVELAPFAGIRRVGQ
jgi:hypothetical protein